MYRKPEHWADPAASSFPYQMGFTAPPTGFLRTGTSRQSCNSLIILDKLEILRIPPADMVGNRPNCATAGWRTRHRAAHAFGLGRFDSEAASPDP